MVVTVDGFVLGKHAIVRRRRVPIEKPKRDGTVLMRFMETSLGPNSLERPVPLAVPWIHPAETAATYSSSGISEAMFTSISRPIAFSIWMKRAAISEPRAFPIFL
jgi:hypothetical protein